MSDIRLAVYNEFAAHATVDSFAGPREQCSLDKETRMLLNNVFGLPQLVQVSTQASITSLQVALTGVDSRTLKNLDAAVDVISEGRRRVGSLRQPNAATVVSLAKHNPSFPLLSLAVSLQFTVAAPRSETKQAAIWQLRRHWICGLWARKAPALVGTVSVETRGAAQFLLSQSSPAFSTSGFAQAQVYASRLGGQVTFGRYDEQLGTPMVRVSVPEVTSMASGDSGPACIKVEALLPGKALRVLGLRYLGDLAVPYFGALSGYFSLRYLPPIAVGSAWPPNPLGRERFSMLVARRLLESREDWGAGYVVQNLLGRLTDDYERAFARSASNPMLLRRRAGREQRV